MVKVEHNDSELALFPDRPAQFAFQRLFHVASVEQAGEDVPRRLDTQRLAQFHVPQGQSNLRGHSHGQPLGGLHLEVAYSLRLVQHVRGHL